MNEISKILWVQKKKQKDKHHILNWFCSLMLVAGDRRSLSRRATEDEGHSTARRICVVVLTTLDEFVFSVCWGVLRHEVSVFGVLKPEMVDPFSGLLQKKVIDGQHDGNNDVLYGRIN